jgi:hypothetical protein
VELSSTAKKVEGIASKETLEIGNRKLPSRIGAPRGCNQHPRSATEVSLRVDKQGVPPVSVDCNCVGDCDFGLALWSIA